MITCTLCGQWFTYQPNRVAIKRLRLPEPAVLCDSCAGDALRELRASQAASRAARRGPSSSRRGVPKRTP
jgi:hypothetical protein